MHSVEGQQRKKAVNAITRWLVCAIFVVQFFVSRSASFFVFCLNLTVRLFYVVGWFVPWISEIWPDAWCFQWLLCCWSCCVRCAISIKIHLKKTKQVIWYPNWLCIQSTIYILSFWMACWGLHIHFHQKRSYFERVSFAIMNSKTRNYALPPKKRSIFSAVWSNNTILFV